MTETSNAFSKGRGKDELEKPKRLSSTQCDRIGKSYEKEMDSVIRSYCDVGSPYMARKIRFEKAKRSLFQKLVAEKSPEEESHEEETEEEKSTTNVDLNRSLNDCYGSAVNEDVILNQSFEECLESGYLRADILIDKPADEIENMDFAFPDEGEEKTQSGADGDKEEDEGEEEEITDEMKQQLNKDLEKAEKEWEVSERLYVYHPVGRLTDYYERKLSSDPHFNGKEQERHLKEMAELARKMLEKEMEANSEEDEEKEKMSPIEVVDGKKLFESEEEDDLERTVGKLNL